MGAGTYHCHGVKMAWGQVRHRREKPKANGFATGACFVKLVFKPEPCAHTLPRYPVIDGRGLASVSASHYGFEQHNERFDTFIPSLVARVEGESSEALGGEVHLHTFPKTFGFVFNPVSFWYFHNTAGQCRALLCEVNNTFGERHFYLLHQEGPFRAPLDKGQAMIARKVFHVSPFFPVSGHYEFRFFNQADRTLASIRYFDQGELKLSTSVSGTLVHPSTALWCRTWMKYGWFTLAVVVKIHWQAVKLLFKGAKFHRKPEPPSNVISQTELNV
ncbi:DUF1365 domain-containing protein [Limnobacter humi]|uniref:DUF1365 domain-containing protein n=1 Tax=Limnobacter humi TaxID=1778671 RepID=A0ABT1WBM7_9BURK|nr:DUF1365 domain-containing protein [Limnobacter humi]MCQ8894913.1 DUF1365 domain-containing protein [Limnobacter humi]